LNTPSESFTRAIFVSDLHLGALGADPEKESRFIDFLRRLNGRISHLIIVGDLFEFWMEYRHFIPKKHFKVLAELHQLERDGTQIHYTAGNHDFKLASFFQDQLSIHIHHGPWVLELESQRILVLHGDGLSTKDTKYRLIRPVLHHPLSQFCFKLLHPDMGMYIALKVGALSRKNHKPAQIYFYRPAASKLLKDYHADILIHGHTHEHFIEDLEGKIYANAGNWVSHQNYLLFEKGKLSLHNY